VGGKYCCC